MARKPHPSSVLKTLPDEDQAALFEFLRDKTLADGVDWLFSNNGVRTNDSSLSDWRGWYQLNRNISTWESEVDELKAALEKTGTDPDLIPKLGEAVFLAKAAKTGDVKAFATVAAITQRHHEMKASQQQHADKMTVKGKELAQRDQTIKQKDKQIELQRRKIEAYEAKMKQADEVAEDQKLTAEEKVLRWKQIFGR